MHGQGAVFIDRDGTLIELIPYLSDPAQVVLLPGTVPSLQLLSSLGFKLIVTTNQSGIGRALFTESHMHAVHRKMEDLLRGHGIALDAIYWCPHTPGQACACRKPQPGMGLRAVAEQGLDLGRCFVVGDAESDIGFAQALGVPGIRVLSGIDPERPTSNGITVTDVHAAAQHIATQLAGEGDPQ